MKPSGHAATAMYRNDKEDKAIKHIGSAVGNYSKPGFIYNAESILSDKSRHASRRNMPVMRTANLSQVGDARDAASPFIMPPWKGNGGVGGPGLVNSSSQVVLGTDASMQDLPKLTKERLQLPSIPMRGTGKNSNLQSEEYRADMRYRAVQQNLGGVM